MLEHAIAHRRQPRATLERIANEVRRRPEHPGRRPGRRTILHQLRGADGQHERPRPAPAIEQRQDAVQPVEIPGIHDGQLRRRVPRAQRLFDRRHIDSMQHEGIADDQHRPWTADRARGAHVIAHRLTRFEMRRGPCRANLTEREEHDATAEQREGTLHQTTLATGCHDRVTGVSSSAQFHHKTRLPGFRPASHD